MTFGSFLDEQASSNTQQTNPQRNIWKRLRINCENIVSNYQRKILILRTNAMKLLKRILRLFSKHFLIFIGITAVVELIIFYFFIPSRTRQSAGRVFEMWLDIVPNVVTHPIFWLLVLVPYLLYRLVKSLIGNYKKAGWKGNKHSSYSNSLSKKRLTTSLLCGETHPRGPIDLKRSKEACITPTSWSS